MDITVCGERISKQRIIQKGERQEIYGHTGIHSKETSVE